MQVYLYLLATWYSATFGLDSDRSRCIPRTPLGAFFFKLVELCIASKDSYGWVMLVRKVRLKAPDSYVNFGRFTVPRLAFYTTLFSAIALLYVLVAGPSLYGIAVPAAAAGLFWLETLKVWKYSLLRGHSRLEPAPSGSLWPSLVPCLAALTVFVAWRRIPVLLRHACAPCRHFRWNRRLWPSCCKQQADL